jgi:multiple sugar transport system substrate-binding protein
MQSRDLILATMLILSPFAARAADLVVWWGEGFYPQENEAVREIVAAFEQRSGQQVELTFYEDTELLHKLAAALEGGWPPGFVWGIELSEYLSSWAFEDRLVDLSDAIGHFSDSFDPEVLDWVTVLNGRTKQKALYGLPIGSSTTHIHVWKSLLERAGLTLADIPKEWEAFWSFWCDRVQPAVRKATGRSDIWGIGQPMSAEGVDANEAFLQFLAIYEADYVTRDGRLLIDDPEIRRKLVVAMDRYTASYRKGCTPPDAVGWDSAGNNEAFLAQSVVMTLNQTLSIPNALKTTEPDDYYENTATIEWPLGPASEPFPIFGMVSPAMAFKDAGQAAAAKEFVGFLVSEGWLAHYLNFSGERLLPPFSKLLDQPFWLDPSDPHRMASVMQVSARPLALHYAAASGDWRHDRAHQERVWGKAIHRVAADGISPEQAIDEAIARIKQILSE